MIHTRKKGSHFFWRHKKRRNSNKKVSAGQFLLVDVQFEMEFPNDTQWNRAKNIVIIIMILNGNLYQPNPMHIFALSYFGWRSFPLNRVVYIRYFWWKTENTFFFMSIYENYIKSPELNCKLWRILPHTIKMMVWYFHSFFSH